MLQSSPSFCATAERDLVPPPQLPNTDNVVPTLGTSPIRNIHLGKLSIELEHTTLHDIQESAGVGTIHRRGDAGGSESWVCFTIVSEAIPERVWLASGELGGLEHHIDSFYASVSLEPPSASCPALPARLHPVSLGDTVWLGAELRELKHLSFKPSGTMGDWQFFSYSGKVLNGFDRLAIFGVHVSRGRIDALYESQVTTN